MQLAGFVTRTMGRVYVFQILYIEAGIWIGDNGVGDVPKIHT